MFVKRVENNDLLKYYGEGFVLSYRVDDDFFTLDSGSTSQRFYIYSGCDTLDEYDTETSSRFFSSYEEDIASGECLLKWRMTSNLWEKEYRLLIQNDRIEYQIVLYGNGKLDAIHYFSSAKDTSEIEKLLSSRRNFNDKKPIQYFDVSHGYQCNYPYIWGTDPNNYGKWRFNNFEKVQISCHADLDFCGGNFIFSPAPFAYTLDDGKSFLLLGVLVESNKASYSEFHFDGGDHLSLSLNFWGATTVKGTFESPKMLLLLGDNREKLLSRYASSMEKSEKKESIVFKWWNGPLICGWGEQCYMGDLFRVRSPVERKEDTAVYDMCTQGNYQWMVSLLEKQKIPWEIICIDARWTIASGRKELDVGRWPDLRAFVDNVHAKGKKVLLWWGLWEHEGLPQEWCITYQSNTKGKRNNRLGRVGKFGGISEGTAISPDPTVPAFQSFISQRIEALLGNGEGCMDVDGLKIDHVAAAPGLYGMRFPKHSQRLIGIDLIYFYQKNIYDTCKRVKKDALIIGQSVLPLFHDCQDMVRLGDMYCVGNTSIIDEMHQRERITRSIFPGIPIDPDNWPIPDKESLFTYLAFQKEIGIQSLYYISGLDTTGEPFTSSDYDKIREVMNHEK